MPFLFAWFVVGVLAGGVLTTIAWQPRSLYDAIELAWLEENGLAAQKSHEKPVFLKPGLDEYQGWPPPSIDRYPEQFPLAAASVIGSGFGWRPHPLTGMTSQHDGLDLVAPAGTPILAAGSGHVVKAGWQGGYGLLVEILHAPGLSTRYAHAQKVFVHEGDWVGRGQMLAEVGSTGLSTGPHLHFEVRMRGHALDPLLFVGKDAGLALR